MTEPESIATRLFAMYDAMLTAGLGAPVQRSDFVRQVMAPLLTRRWKERCGGAPALRTALSQRETEILGQLVAELETTIRAAAGCCTQVVNTVSRLLADAGSPTALGFFSERICVWVRQRCADGHPPSAQECDEFAHQLVAGAGAVRPLAQRTFAQTYAQPYDAQWQRDGADNLRRYPPSACALGRDAQPELVRGTKPGRTNPGHRDWSQGTNRPVFERYRLWFKKSARVAPPVCRSPQCQARALMSIDDPAPAEVSRACDVYGLAQAAHQQIVRSIAYGLGSLDKPGHGWVAWEAWAQPCQPIDLTGEWDSGLADAVSSALSAWADGPVGAPLVRQFGFDRLVGPLTAVVVRKIWMGLHGYERTFAQPMRRCGIPRLVRVALYRTAPTAVREWIAGTIGDDWAEPESEPVTAVDAHRRLDARDATFRLLADHPELVERMGEGDPAWRADYERLANDDPAVEYLACDDAFVAVRDLLETMNDPRGA